MAGNILRMAIPMTIAQMVNVLYSVVDRFFSGPYRRSVLHGAHRVGIVFPIISLITAFTNLFGMGDAPLCSIARGRQDLDLAGRIQGSSCYMLGLTAVVLTAIGVLFMRPILEVFGASPDTYPYARDYFSVYIWERPLPCWGWA